MRIYIAVFLLLSITSGRPIKHYRQPPLIQGTTITTFQSPMSIFAGTGGTSTASPDTVFAGTNSNKITFGNASQVTFIGAMTPVNVCSDSFIRVHIFFKNKAAVANLSSMSLIIGNNTSNYRAFSIGYKINDTLLSTNWGRWQNYAFILRKFSTVGSPNCATFDTIGIAAQAKATTQDTAFIGGVYTYAPRIAKATMIVTNDDNDSSWFAWGHKKMDSLHYHYTAFVTVDRFGIPGCISAAAMNSLYLSSGIFEVGSHLNTHDTAGIRTVDSTYRLVKLWWDFSGRWGWRGRTLLALPYGSKNRAMDSMMRVSGIVDFVRMTANDADGEAQQFNDSYSAAAWIILGNSITLAQAKANLDSLILNKSVGILICHEIVTGGTTGSTYWAQSDFSAFMDYAKTKVDAGTLVIQSLGEWMKASYSPPPVRRSGRRR